MVWVETRKAELSDVAAIANVIVQTWKEAYQTIMPDEILLNLISERYVPYIKEDIESCDKMIFVAENDKREIVGMVSGGICRESRKDYDRELYAVYVLPEFQKQGIGGLLFAVFLNGLKQNSFQSFYLRVLKANLSARHFYERMQGERFGNGVIDINGISFETICYGWSTLDLYDAKNDYVELVEYQTDWQAMAQVEIEGIKERIGNQLFFDIRHIGSTAVIGIKAKPILDFLIGVQSIEESIKSLIELLGSLGYFFWEEGRNTSKPFFVKGFPPFGKRRTHHIHIVEKRSESWRAHLLFRNYLLKHSDVAKEYKALKIRLEKRFSHDREAYSEGKKGLINKILQKAASSLCNKRGMMGSDNRLSWE